MSDFTGFFRRLRALVYKEFLQLSRDNSSLLLGIALPLVLILLIGYGISLDVKNVPTAVVLEDTSPTAQDSVSFLTGSDYFDPRYVTSMKEAELLMEQRKADVILRIPPDFTQKLEHGEAKIQAILYGVETTTSMTVQGYLETGLASWLEARQGSTHGAVIVTRMWFNDANTSSWFFVPGLIMLIMTIVGVFLTAVVMAREWERGTFESLFVTPVQAAELILAKMIPYFCVLVAGHYLYGVPLRGSIILILAVSMLFLIVALGIGLVISALTKNQFNACQLALLVTFMPSVMISGFLFDMHSQPIVIQIVGQLFPTTYYLVLLKSLFLSGNNFPLIIKNSLALVVYAVLFLGLAFHITRKRVEE